MIRHIIFDMGNVLLRFDRELFLDRVGAAGEDRRKMTLAVKDTGKQGLLMRAMQGDSRTLAWIYDRGYFNSQKENAQPAAKGDVSISLPVKFSGKCRIELWSTSGGMISTADGIAKNGAAEVLLPAFCRDAAVKIIKSE